jgi:hypothetical protein
MTPYALIPLVVSVVLGARYLAMGDPSRWSKAVVVIAVAASLVIWWKYPEWLLVASIAQVAVSIYVLVYLRVNPYAV